MKFMRSAVLTLAIATFVIPMCTNAAEEGFRSIFNGKDLSGWDGNPKFWSVQDGAITGQTTPDNPTDHNTFVIWRLGEVDDFELHFSYKIIGGNSGVQYRSKEMEDWIVGGYQGDFEAGDTYSGINYEERGRGILALRGQKVTIDENGEKKAETFAKSEELQKAIKKEDWNDYVVIAKGNHLTHMINGKVTSEVIDNQPSKSSRSGILAFQLHAGPPMKIQIKDVQLKRLPMEDKTKIVLVAGWPSHPPKEHEHNAGILLFKKCLNENVPEVFAVSYHNRWPEDPTAFDNAKAIVLYSDGGSGHPILRANALEQVDKLMAKGLGIGFIHYAVEIPKDNGGPEFLKWVGGYYETGYSINPHWDAKLHVTKGHPITRGVDDFEIRDEWYFNIRFRDGMKGVTPLLKAVPPDDVRKTPAAAEHPGRSEVLSWCVERPDGGRGFGFTGGHFHVNWGNDSLRKYILNAILWIAKVDVPEGGVESKVTEEDLMKNLDDKRRR